MDWEVKNPLKAQSKYGLMGYSAKIGKKNYRQVTGAKNMYFVGPKSKKCYV